MTEDVPDREHDPEGAAEPDFDDPAYADVRALLAGARETAPVPADVAAALEATLADLVAARSAEQTGEQTAGASVVPLRRTWPSRFLVAASTVVLLGAGAIGLAQVVGNGSSDDAASSTGSSAARDAGVSPAAPEAAADSAGGGTAAEAPDALLTNLSRLADGYGAGTLPTFSAQRFDQQAADFVQGTYRLQGQDDAQAPAPGAPLSGAPESGGAASGGTASQDLAQDGSAAQGERSRLLDRYRADATCPGPAVDDGSTVLRIRYADRAATLVVHPAVAGRRLVEAWSCEGTELLASTTVSAS